MYGAEYEMRGNVPSSSLPLNNEDVPCAVCYVATRDTVLMISGTYICPQTWTREYYGWLMSEHHSHHRSTFECVAGAATITSRKQDVPLFSCRVYAVYSSHPAFILFNLL